MKKSDHKREIGSNFCLSKEEFDYYFSLSKNNINQSRTGPNKNRIYLSSGRQAIRYALQEANINNRRALLPQFTCGSVIQAFLQEDFEIDFYPVNLQLRTKMSKIIKQAKSTAASLVLVHPYFGLSTIEEDEIMPDDIIMILDSTQSLFSNIKYKNADYLIASLRKWGPFLDGAFCEKNEGILNYEQSFYPDYELIALLKRAYEKKAEYLSYKKVEKQSFLDDYSQAFALLGSRDQIYAMAPESLAVYCNYDFSAMKMARRNNYNYLLENIDWQKVGSPVFPYKLSSEVPLYLPFYCNRTSRKNFQRYMAEHNVYLPIIWPRPDYFSTNEQELSLGYIYQNILCFPIDQRYSLSDMSVVAGLVNQY